MAGDQRSEKSFAYAGGLNLITPHRQLKPGEIIGGFNYEVALGGGYLRMDGIERFDGRAPKPSDATYERIAFNAGANRTPRANDVIVGATSGATAIVVATPALTSGAWLTGDGVGSLPFTKRVGNFAAGENITIGGVTFCHSTAVAVAGSRGDADYKACMRGAQAVFRALILTVPGSGSVRGAHVYKGDVYAWRDNAGGTACVMHKATAGGWVPITLSTRILFTNGLGAEIFEGDTITGVTSGATATVQRVNINTGTWTGPTAAQGRLIITAIVGVFINGEVLNVTGTARCVAASAAAAQTWLPGGTFQVENYNFYGAANRLRMYGVDSVNAGWEFDGTVFCFIDTGMAVNTPKRVAVHKNHLFFGFPGGSVQNAGVGRPLDWTVRAGADDLGIGDEITAIYSIREDVLGIWGDNTIGVLYGSSNNNWLLKKQGGKVGGRPRSIAEMDGLTTFADARGVFDITTALAQGDPGDVALSRRVKPLIVKKMAGLVSAMVIRDRSQVRYFFNDKTSLTITYTAGQVLGWMPQTYPVQFTCTASGEDAAGAEILFAGGDDGYVYQLNRGTNFDGVAIDSLLRPAFWDYGSPLQEKNFHGLMVQTDSPFPVALQVVTEFDYGKETGIYPSLTTEGGGGLWGQANWGEFFWDGAIVGTPSAQIDGWGLNMAASIFHSDDIDQAFALQSALVVFSRHGVRQL